MTIYQDRSHFYRLKNMTARGGSVFLMWKNLLQIKILLSDPNFYREIPRDHTNKNTTEIHKFLLSMKTKKLLPDAHVNFIMPRNCRTPLFYLLPKIHKKNNPGRPIVSACDSPTEKNINVPRHIPSTSR